MDFEEMIDKFKYKHPICTWILSRFVICICACSIVALAFFGLVVLGLPFVQLIDGGGLKSFIVWLWMPLIATVIWLSGSIIGYVWEEMIQ